MADVTNSIKLLFDRPGEPLISPKGDGNKYLFQLTEEFLPDDYKDNGVDLNNRFGSDAEVSIPLKKFSRTPEFPLAKTLDRFSDLCLFNPHHQEMTKEVINTFMAVPEGNLQDFLSCAVYARCHLNAQLFNYCYTVAVLHRRDTRNIRIPNHAESFPSKFLDSRVLPDAREAAQIANKAGVSVPPIIIPRDFTASDLETEHKLAYFREDIGVNLHHWHWHIVYPGNADVSIVNKDRRGELFFYMHQQIVARYNTERLCNGLNRVVKFNNFRERIPEAYFPKLDSLTSARGYPPRQANMRWQDINRPVDSLTRRIADMETWRKNIDTAIASGRCRMANGREIPLTIDILANMVESSVLSPNRELYGDLHNSGHIMSGYIHDPDHRYLEANSVMADEAITMRDPMFYRWHGFIDDLFQSFKESPASRPYTDSELDNPGVRITGVSLQSQGVNAPNVLNTFWMQSDVDLSRGLDFSDRAPVLVRFTHLNHRDFTYTINVNNTASARRCTVRIFLAPTQNERNTSWQFSEHRKMFIEMDRFVTPLSQGNNTINRTSKQSTVTIPFEQTFRDLSVQGSNPNRQDIAGFNFCGCGWPQHMLVPKGTEGGMAFQLFVMCSNYEMDKVDQPNGAQLSCDDASSFCGLQDQLYPDKRSMGFPFDRASRSPNLQQFLKPNMAVQTVTIRFQNNTVQNPRNPRSDA